MATKTLQEGEIAELIKTRTPEYQFYCYRPKDFIAYKVDSLWIITFTYLDKAGCELHLKRGGVRKFSNLSTVENFLRKLGVTEFKVIL